MNKAVKKMEKDSAYTQELPEGCKLCRKGSKLVLLVTGKCSGSCWYCPLSEEKKGKDVLYSNEKRSFSDEDILKEAEMIDAEGAGITGGDPLEDEDTYHYIKLLKDTFGKDFHIHLYTQSTEIEMVEKAVRSGLDEIRFHPPPASWSSMEETDYIEILEELQDIDVDVGIEIPCIPGFEEEMHQLIEVMEDLVSFINFNELEFSSTNWEELVERDYEEKSDISSAVKGSQEVALDLLKSESNRDISLHYCSASFKDGVQLTNRVKRRAENVAREGDLVTEEGMLVRGIILSDEPFKLVEQLKNIYDIPSEMIWVDEEKDRVNISLPILEEIADELEDYECYGVEEYPTADRLEVERWPIR